MGFDIDVYLQALDDGRQDSTFNLEYMTKHVKRFKKTIEVIEAVRGKRALEIGATDFFQLYLSQVSGYQEVWGTVLSSDNQQKFYKRSIALGEFGVQSTTVSLDVESDLFPVTAGYFDFIMIAEVIEHMDIDPMFALAEFNRVL